MEASQAGPEPTPTGAEGDAAEAANENESSHAPAATAQQEAIVGNAGLGEQQPAPGFVSQDTPLIGAQAPQAQSGVPLPEDRAAGVQPNEDMRGSVATPHSPGGSVPAGATEAQGQGQPAAEPEDVPADAPPESAPAE
jgi:hypothetical protein